MDKEKKAALLAEKMALEAKQFKKQKEQKVVAKKTLDDKKKKSETELDFFSYKDEYLKAVCKYLSTESDRWQAW